MTKIGPLFDSSRCRSERTRQSLDEATAICGRLVDAGHVAYFAGGCVRDALLGREPKDFDVATDATPERVRKIFGQRRTLAFGASFGVIGVLPERRNRNRNGVQPTEVATFRSDGTYSDGRRPDRVHFGDAKHDALRRDFTINGLFFDPASEKVIDFVGGRDDLASKRLRTIGSPAERFEEDKLRMLRAVRFATTLGFDLDPRTQAELLARADQIAIVSAERIGAEMQRIMTSLFAPRGLELLIACGLHTTIFPELTRSHLPRIAHLLSHRKDLNFDITMALVFLSLCQPQSQRHVPLIASTADRWRLSNESVRRIKAGVEHWGTITEANQQPWSKVQPLLIDRDIDCVLSVAAVMVDADDISAEGIDRCRRALKLPADQLNPDPLIDGQTLQAAGYRPGPQFRSWLQTIRQLQLDGQIHSREQAMAQIVAMDQKG